MFTSKTKSNVQVFKVANTSTDNVGMQSWYKPRGVSMIQFFAVSGGGGGGGGFSGAVGGGGGGGACSGLTRFICPAIFLPDILDVQVGAGGQGGADGTNGANGLNSYVCTGKNFNLPNRVVTGSVVAPSGGAPGTLGAGGAGGVAPTIAVTQPIHTWGMWFSNVGLVGATGGNPGVAGTSVTAWATPPLSPGAGGGGGNVTDFDGGAQTASALTDMESQGYYPTGAGNICKAGTGTGAAIDGSSFNPRLTPFFNAGGAGGGSNVAGVGGIGGAAGYGCGGGGGGSGLTGGRGGKGGDGIVIIIAW